MCLRTQGLACNCTSIIIFTRHRSIAQETTTSLQNSQLSYRTRQFFDNMGNMQILHFNKKSTHIDTIQNFQCIQVVCPKRKCTDFLFKCLLDSPEITSYLLQSMGSYTEAPTFLPLIIAVLEVIFRKCVQLIGYNFLYVLHRPEMMTLQLRFQLREEVEIARSQTGMMWKYGNVFLRQKFSN